MSNDESSSVEMATGGPRFQFSLATLMIAVTVVAMCCGLFAWLGAWGIPVLLLVVGPIGGAIAVRVCKSRPDLDMAVWSGMITVAAIGVAIGAAVLFSFCLHPSPASAGHVFIGLMVFVLASPFAMLVGLLTGCVGQAVCWLGGKCWRLLRGGTTS